MNTSMTIQNEYFQYYYFDRIMVLCRLVSIAKSVNELQKIRNPEKHYRIVRNIMEMLDNLERDDIITDFNDGKEHIINQLRYMICNMFIKDYAFVRGLIDCATRDIMT